MCHDVKGRCNPFEVECMQIHAYLTKLSSLYKPLDQLAKPLCGTYIQTSIYKESKHQFELIV